MKKKKLLMFILLGLVVGLSSCGDSSSTSQTSSASSISTSTSLSNATTSAESKKNFEGITFLSKEVTFDGKEHHLDVDGVPNFASISYKNNGPFVDAGTYNVQVTISAEGYNDLTLSSTLTIKKAILSGITFESKTFNYDGNEKEITIAGNIPASAKVIYTSNVNGITNKASEIGTYEITATITDKNFEDLTLKATLEIKVSEAKRYTAMSGSTLFFQNALDRNYLYTYNFNKKDIQRVSYDNAIDIIPTEDNSVMYVSKALLSNSIKSATYDVETSSNKNNSILNISARYIQKDSNSIIYYANNDLLGNKQGIYKVDYSGEEPVTTLLSAGRAKYLQLYGNKIFFADGNNDYKLSSISTSSTNQERKIVVDEKINNLVLNNNVLYYTVNNLLGDYIEKYNISTWRRTKLTSDAGEDLTIIGDYLYYLNVDKLSSLFVGKGIFKVNINPITNNSTSGIKVIDGGKFGICSLNGYDNYLTYYDLDGYKLIRYSIANQSSINLLENFVAPEPDAPLSLGSQIKEKDGVIYYLDLWDEKTLHAYNTITKSNYRLTTEKVDNFSIIGDYIYYNSVTLLVNNDTYRINIKNGESQELVNKYDSTNIISDDKYLYYVERNAGGVATAIHKSNLDGTDDYVIFNYGADNLILNNNTLYFCAKPNAVQTIMKIENISNITTPQEKICVNSDYASDVFTIYNNNIYFRRNYGLAWKFHKLAKMDLNGNNYEDLIIEGTDPTEIVVKDNYIYYVNSAETANDFDIYKCNLDGTNKEKITNKCYPSSICLFQDNIYFVNYYLIGTLGDSYLYSVSLKDGKTTKIN